MNSTNYNNHNINGYNPAIEIINDAQFEDMRELLAEDFAELLQIYIAESQQRLLTLQRAQASDNNSHGFEAAHALKGASANLGASQLVDLSDQLQEACRQRNIGQQTALIAQTATALQRVEQQINQRLGQ